MALYRDTGALLKRYVAEPDSHACERRLLGDLLRSCPGAGRAGPGDFGLGHPGLTPAKGSPAGPWLYP